MGRLVGDVDGGNDGKVVGMTDGAVDGFDVGTSVNSNK